MALQLSKNAELKLSIFTPLIGSLVYELRANLKTLLIINFDERNYILTRNIQQTRKNMLGMDISLNELKWIILGDIPKKTPNWKRENISKNKFELIGGNTKIIIEFNSLNKIKYLEKYLNGFLEYRADIQIYKTFIDQNFPRKIIIKDYSGLNHWLILISEIQIPYETFKPLNFTPPPKMRPLKN